MVGLRAQVGNEAATILWLPVPVSLGRKSQQCSSILTSSSVVPPSGHSHLQCGTNRPTTQSRCLESPQVSRACLMNALLFPGPDASEETTLLPGEGPRAWGVPVFFLCAFSCCQVGIPRTAEIPGCPLAGAPPPVSTEPGLSQDHRAESASVFQERTLRERWPN